MNEIELKFLLTEDQADRLDAALPLLEGLHGAPSLRDLVSIYHDTDDGALRRAGIALRLRHDGDVWVQAVKARAAHHGAMQTVHEAEGPLPGGTIDLGAIPDPALRDAVLAARGSAALTPQLETRIRRHAATLDLPGGGTAEIAVDRGTVHGGGQSAALAELEIELKSGAVADLFDLARQLLPEGGLRLSRRSKAARAFALADGRPAIMPPAPAPAAPVPLQPDQSAETAARDVLRSCFDQIARNAELVAASDMPEGPHQLRIGLRRLRAAFTLFRDVTGGPVQRHLAAEARWLAREAGAVRDLDVAIGDLVGPEIAAHPAEPGFDRLAAHLAARVEARRRDLRAALFGPRAHAFLLDLARFTETRGWIEAADFDQSARLAQPLSALLPARLERHWRRARKRARNIDALGIEARHELRKALKNLRYAVEFAAPALPRDDTRLFLKRLRKLQNLFGALNDLSMAQALFIDPGAPGADDPAAQRAAGWVMGRRSARAEDDWGHAWELWRALRAAPRPWAAE